MICYKEYESPHGGLVIGACDKDLLGKTFQEGELILECKESFYGNTEISREDLQSLLSKCVSANIIGKESIEAAKEAGIIEETRNIEGVPFAHFIRL